MGVGYSSDDDPGTLEFGRESKEERKTIDKHSSASKTKVSWWGMTFMVCETWRSSLRSSERALYAWYALMLGGGGGVPYWPYMYWG